MPETSSLAATMMPRRPRSRKSKASGVHLPDPRQSQNAQRNYERYLALARAEALGGDLVAAENYFQHAEHYLRSMYEQRNTGGSRGNR
jgi:hypothetical protein